MGKLGVTGVRKVGNKFGAKIQIGKRFVWLGTFDTIGLASSAYVEAKKTFGRPSTIVVSDKKCTKCDSVRSAHMFDKHKHTRDRLDSWCRPCRLDARRKALENPEYREKVRRRRLELKDANITKHRDKVLRQKFGLSIEQYNQIFTDQNGVCAICHRPESSKDVRRGKIKNLAVDHCHKTNQVRGLLCDRCNTSIGKFEDDPALLRRAIVYLQMARPDYPFVKRKLST